MKMLVTTVLTLTLLVPVAFSRGKPDKPGGGGDPYIVGPGNATIDGDLSDWSDCDNSTAIPLHWAGARNKPVLVTVCLRYDASMMLLYVRGLAKPDDDINDKPDSMHMKLDKVKLWEDTDRGLDGYQPELAVSGEGSSAGGYPIVEGWEASTLVQPGTYKTVIHASVCPGGDCNEGAGQSSRTLKGLEIRIHPIQ